MSSAAEVSGAEVGVRCSFHGCSPSIILRTVMAVVDQLSLRCDANIAILDALDFPLGESIEAFHHYGIESAHVRFDGSDLVVALSLSSRVADPIDLLGDSADVVSSFFAVGVADNTSDATTVVLTGSLQ